MRVTRRQEVLPRAILRSIVAEYTTFEEVISSLPEAVTPAGTPQDALRVVEEDETFIEPLMRHYEVTASAQTTFISARGASGKSAMANQISRRLGAPLWSLGEDKAVSGDALTARLAAFLGVVDPLAEAVSGNIPLLIIDAMDEARLRVTGLSWDEFMASLVQYARAGVHLVILGRKRTIEDVWISLAESDISVSWYEISHFNKAQQSDYVDLRALRGASQTGAYQNARDAVLAELNGANDAALDEAFAGYAPVLDAVAALLRPPVNYLTVLNDFQSVTAGGARLKVLRRILETLLDREQSKVIPLAEQLGVSAKEAYTPNEQLTWLAAELLGGPPPRLDWCPVAERSEYVDLLTPFLLDHPFREGQGWASPVFSSYSALMRIDDAEARSLFQIAGLSGLFFEFAAAEASGNPLVINESQFSAIHSSLMAGQWHSSTSVVNVRSSSAAEAGSSVDSATAQLVLVQPDNSATILDATILVDRPGTLQLVSPLANIDVHFWGAVVVTSTSTSIDLGPEVFLRARSIELAGVSLQVSKDVSPGEGSGPTVELEAAESFLTNASLIGNVSVAELSIVVPPTHKLSYPWVQFRSDPDDESGTGADDRARRLLNKLMSLARKHGHNGLRAVYIKKLEGRQGLDTEEFHRAIAVLGALGVVHEDGELLFVDEAWDRHRYDGKGREGMPSYADRREIWDPVIEAVSEAIA